MTPTIRDVAERAGVSAMTVSRVVNGSAHVSAATRAAVEEAIRELGYVPNVLARGLSANRTRTVALVVPDVSNPYFTQIVHGAESVARQAGYRVLLCNTENDQRQERAHIESIVAHQVEGVILAPANDDSAETLQFLSQHETPTVLVDRAVEGLPRDRVHGDGVGDARRLVRHVIDAGRRRIAMITGSLAVSTSRERLRGYREALEQAGLPLEPELLLESTFDAEGGYQAAQRLLWMERRPDAIFAVNNLVAVGVVRALREQRIAIPQDIALVCFDDIEHAAVICPFLTVMVQPAASYGRIAAELLISRIDGSGGDPARAVVLSAELVVRESCGASRRAAG